MKNMFESFSYKYTHLVIFPFCLKLEKNFFEKNFCTKTKYFLRQFNYIQIKVILTNKQHSELFLLNMKLKTNFFEKDFLRKYKK